MRIQIVEDDRALSDGIRLALQETGLAFVQSACLLQAREDFSKEAADIVILDINLPDGSGYDYLCWVKERSDALVLILTANDMETDEVMGLTLVENEGMILKRETLMDRIWTDGAEYVDENALSVTVNRLRRKLEDKRDRVSYIQTIYGQGYMWKKKEEGQGSSHV